MPEAAAAPAAWANSRPTPRTARNTTACASFSFFRGSGAGSISTSNDNPRHADQPHDADTFPQDEVGADAVVARAAAGGAGIGPGKPLAPDSASAPVLEAAALTDFLHAAPGPSPSPAAFSIPFLGDLLRSAAATLHRSKPPQPAAAAAPAPSSTRSTPRTLPRPAPPITTDPAPPEAAPEPASELPHDDEQPPLSDTRELVALLVHTLSHGAPARDPAALQRCLDALHGALAEHVLRPAELLAAPGLLQALLQHVGAPGSAHTGMALESLCGLLADDAEPHAAALSPCVERVVAVLAGARLPLAPALGPPPGPLQGHDLPPHRPPPHHDHDHSHAAEGPYEPAPVNGMCTVAPPRAGRAPAVPAGSAAALVPTWPSPSGGGSSGAGGSSSASGSSGGAPDTTAGGAGWGHDVTSAFFACSAVVRLARYGRLAQALVDEGALPALVRLMRAQPPMVAQVAVFAAYKLVRSLATGGGAGASPAASPLQLQRPPAQQQHAALLQLAEAGGMGSLCYSLGGLNDATCRDMASSLMLDMALAPGVPSVVARRGEVAGLVGLMGSSSGSGSSQRAPAAVVRMYALLVMARLANHSAECQMDAVREGCVGPLLAMLARGCEEEQVHACRLLAILAQAVPTHGTFKDLRVAQAVLPLLSSHRSAVAEHAASVLAILAHNPDNQHHLVGAGAAPLLVPLLTEGTEKCKTYVLATLLLLADAEGYHAAVVARAGAIPPLLMLLEGRQVPHGAVGSASAGLQEFAAAVVCCLARHRNTQPELIEAGGLDSLTDCLTQGSTDAATHAAEALLQLAAADVDTRRLIAERNEVVPALVRLLDDSKAAGRHWAVHLLKTLSSDRLALWHIASARGLVPALCKTLQAGAEDPQATLEAATGTSDDRSPRDVDPSSQAAISGNVAQGSAAAEAAAAALGPSWLARRTRAQAAWLVARLCAHPASAHQVMLSGVCRSMVLLMREALAEQAANTPQGAAGGADSAPLLFFPSANPTRALDYNLVAACTAALLAMAAHSKEGRMAVLTELALQEWMGAGPTVCLPGLMAPHDS